MYHLEEMRDGRNVMAALVGKIQQRPVLGTQFSCPRDTATAEKGTVMPSANTMRADVDAAGRAHDIDGISGPGKMSDHVTGVEQHLLVSIQAVHPVTREADLAHVLQDRILVVDDLPENLALGGPDNVTLLVRLQTLHQQPPLQVGDIPAQPGRPLEISHRELRGDGCRLLELLRHILDIDTATVALDAEDLLRLAVRSSKQLESHDRVLQ